MNLFKMAKVFQRCAVVSKFCKIWSHWTRTISKTLFVFKISPKRNALNLGRNKTLFLINERHSFAQF